MSKSIYQQQSICTHVYIHVPTTKYINTSLNPCTNTQVHEHMSKSMYQQKKYMNTCLILCTNNKVHEPMLSMSSTHLKLASQAKKTSGSINKYQSSFPCKDIVKLFDSMIKPIWGHTFSEVLESVHFNMILLGECGRYPLYMDYYSYCITYWCRLLVMPNNISSQLLYNA